MTKSLTIAISSLLLLGCGGGGDDAPQGLAILGSSESSLAQASSETALSQNSSSEAQSSSAWQSSLEAQSSTGQSSSGADYGGGVLKLILRKTFFSDEYGTQAKNAYNEFKPTMDSKYELRQEFDFCSGSSYVCQADNYAYAIYREERFLSSFYDNGDDVIALALDGSSGSIYDIDLEITYQTQGFSDAIAAQEDDAGADLAPPLYRKMISKK